MHETIIFIHIHMSTHGKHIHRHMYKYIFTNILTRLSIVPFISVLHHESAAWYRQQQDAYHTVGLSAHNSRHLLKGFGIFDIHLKLVTFSSLREKRLEAAFRELVTKSTRITKTPGTQARI